MILTGSKNLDKFISGYQKDRITTIYGESATGKTTLAMLAVIEQIKNNKKVIYIDTENGLSVDRMKLLCPNIEKYLDNLFVLKPKSFEEQERMICSLPVKNIALVVIDTIGKYYRIELNINHKKANDSLIKQIDHLRFLYKLNEIPVMVTNQVHASFEEFSDVKMVGGKMLEQRSKTLIKLEKEPRKILILKPSKKSSLFEIRSEGLFLV